MAKFCGKCGARLDDSGYCPICDGGYRKAAAPNQNTPPAAPVSRKEQRKLRKQAKRDAKKEAKRARRAAMTTGQKVGRFFLKLLGILLALAVLVAAAVYGLFRLGIVEIPSLNGSKMADQLTEANRKCITVDELSITMQSESEGTAEILVRMPDYLKLFRNAMDSADPEEYVLDALKSGKYEICEYNETARVTVESGKRSVHTEESVKKLIEEKLIEAINALPEEKQ